MLWRKRQPQWQYCMLHPWGHSGVMLMLEVGVTIHLFQIVAIGVYLEFLTCGMKFSSPICCQRMGHTFNEHQAKFFSIIWHWACTVLNHTWDGKFFFFQCDLLIPILETFVRYGLSLQIPPTYFSVLVFIISSWQGISQWPKTQCAIGMQWPFCFLCL